MKDTRHNKIIELIEKYEIETQDELAEHLLKAGFKVTQATVSRDIRELKLTKVTAEDGNQKYALLKPHTSAVTDKYNRVLTDGLVSMDTAQNLLVLKTVPGMAMAVAAAVDSLRLDGMVGCIAGDDTIMCAIKSGKDTDKIVSKINDIIDLHRK